jgi:hypothetical protein
MGILRFLAIIFFNDGFRGQGCDMNSSIGKVDAKLWIDCPPDPIASAIVSNVRGGQGQFAALGRGTALIVTDMDIHVPAKAAATRLEETLRPSGDGYAYFKLDLQRNIARHFTVRRRLSIFDHGRRSDAQRRFRHIREIDSLYLLCVGGFRLRLLLWGNRLLDSPSGGRLVTGGNPKPERLPGERRAWGDWPDPGWTVRLRSRASPGTGLLPTRWPSQRNEGDRKESY